MIGIIAAMDAEVNAMKSFVDVTHSENIAGVELTYGKVGNQDVVLCKSGVGKGFAAMSTTVLCLSAKPDAIINIGTAGGLVSNENVLDVVISDTIVQADYDSSPLDGPEGIGLKFKADEKMRDACIEAAKKTGISYHVGTIATQDLFMERKEDFDKLMKYFPDSICSEMEAGSVAQVATQFKVPFVIGRSLSDVVGNGNNSLDFSKYVELASAQSAKLVKAWIEAIE